MATFEQTGMYSISVDKAKNRMHILFLGHWAVPEDIPKYIVHVEQATGMLTPGYTILAEILDKKPPTLKVTPIHKKGQQIMKEAGVSKTAVVVAKGQFLQKMSLSVVGRLSGMTVKTFNTRAEAEAWLEEQ
jgi:hypothetical protein